MRRIKLLAALLGFGCGWLLWPHGGVHCLLCCPALWWLAHVVFGACGVWVSPRGSRSSPETLLRMGPSCTTGCNHNTQHTAANAQAIYGLVMRALQVRHAGGLILRLPRPAYARVCGFLYNKVAATNACPTYTTIKIPSKRHDHASAHFRVGPYPAQACVTKTECCQVCMGVPWRAIMATAYWSVHVHVLLLGSMLYGPVQSRALS
jgi:hypothetical protein